MEDDDLVSAWRALSDPSRRHILDLLCRQPMTTGDIAARFPMSRIAIMKHLTVLADAGLAVPVKRGRERWHYANFVPLQRIHERWLDPQAGRWAASLTALKRRVEKGERRMSDDGDRSWPLAIDIVQEIDIEAVPDRVFAALTGDIAAWWGHPYLNSAATGLILEARPGGRFYEIWDGAGDGEQGALLAFVSAIQPPHRLELTGRLHMGVVQGAADFRLEAHGDGTRLRFSHRAIGHVDPAVAAGLEAGWTDLLAGRLKPFVETGAQRGVGGKAET